MRLLVSVRSAEEAGAALEGGADIIDAKEPSRGGLGAVDPEVLRIIAAAVPVAVPLSVALGDFSGPVDVSPRIRAMAVERAGGEIFLKLGFSGQPSETAVEAMIVAAVAATSQWHSTARVIAVAYADWARVGGPSPDAVTRSAIRAGAAGALIDTSLKDGTTLFSWMTEPELGSWICESQAAGLLAAVAGSLDPEGIPAIRAVHPDVIGVRGSACDGGRLGRVSTSRVRSLRQALDTLAALPL